jgi:hypothetical protein
MSISGRESGIFLTGSRLFIFILWISAAGIIEAEQPDTSSHYSLRAGTSYFDIFRQTTSSSSLKIFSQTSDVTLSYTAGLDTLTYRNTWRDDGLSVNNYNTGVTFSASRRLTISEVQWASCIGPFGYSLRIRIPFSTAHSPSLYYGSSLSFHTDNDLLTLSGVIDINPVPLSSHVQFQDFTMSLDELGDERRIGLTMSGKPFQDLTGTLSFTQSRQTNEAGNSSHSVFFSNRGLTNEASLWYSPAPETELCISALIQEIRNDATLYSDKLSFGDLASAQFQYFRYSIGGRAPLFGLPFKLFYHYQTFTVNGVGQIESWPFTTLAASIIVNRLYYRLNGDLLVHVIETGTAFGIGPVTITPRLQYLFLRPKLYIDHWQPQFIIFGISNAGRDYFPIDKAQVLWISAGIQIPFFGESIECSFSQFVPLILTLRHSTHEINGTPTATSPKNAITDGGREFRLSLMIEW